MTKIHLIYSNKMPESISFGGELEEWAKGNDNFKLDLVITQPEESKKPWKGLRGRIDETMIRKLVGEIKKVTFWICGPPAMVDGMEKQMGKLKISIGKVRSEKFTGY